MFPSAGYFRGVMCPFFAHGLCHRPYCHFKHVAPSDNFSSRHSVKQASSKPAKSDTDPSIKVQTARSDTSQVQPPKDTRASPTLQYRDTRIDHKHQSDCAAETSKDGVTLGMDVETHTAGVTRNERSSKVDVSDSDTTTSNVLMDHLREVEYDVPEDSPEKMDLSVLSDRLVVGQQVEAELSSDEVVAAKKTRLQSDSDQDDASLKGYFDDIGSAVHEVLSAYSVPGSDKSTPIQDSSSAMSRDKIGANDKKPLETNRLMEKYSSGIRIKKRIAHSGAAVAKAVKAEEEKQEAASRCSTPHAPMQAKKRVAHTSKVSSSPSACKTQKPVIPLKAGGKIPTNLRQKYLDCFVDEYLKICSSDKEAYDKAKAEEETIFSACNMRQSYTNRGSLTLKHLRNQAAAASSPTCSKAAVSGITEAQPTENRLCMDSTNKTKTESLKRKAREFLESSAAANEEPATKKLKPCDMRETAQPVAKDSDSLTLDVLYQLLLPYALSEDQLCKFGFPQPHQSSSTVAAISESGLFKAHPIKQLSDTELQHTCCRCGKLFSMTPDGWYLTKESCIYHYGRLRKARETGEIHSVYSCCQGVSASAGCQVAECHVTSGEQDSVRGGFVTTTAVTDVDSSGICPGVYALDCEMCYTAAGLELTRVTVVDHTLKSTYEALVKPDLPIVDYNTRFSGITVSTLANVITRLEDVQQHLLTLFSADTILIGHSLNSDLVALKLIHSKVVDTSIVFPHPRGLPYRRALRTLAAEILRKIIQENAGGHDSFEDSAVCMELAIWKAKKDLRKQRRRPTSKVK